MFGFLSCVCINPVNKQKYNVNNMHSMSTASSQFDNCPAYMNHAELVTRKGKRFFDFYTLGNIIDDAVGVHGEIRKCKHK